MPAPLTLPEPDARAVMLVGAAEQVGDSPLWTADDRAWATRLARETLVAEAAAKADDARALAARAHHALQRLLPRAPALAAAFEKRSWRRSWALFALGLGALFGLFADQLGGTQRINLLAPPVWAVVLWNLALYAVLLLSTWRAPAGTGRARRALERWIDPPLDVVAAGRRLSPAEQPIAAGFASAWAEAARPLRSVRSAALLHLAAAGLALGMIGGLYLRGAVLDFRAGWQSTFLSAGTVQAVLDVALAPAATLTGVPVPDVSPLRVSAEQPPQGEAAAWLHLYAATLLLFVVLPRGVLALRALGRGAWLARRVPLPANDLDRVSTLRGLGGAPMRLQVIPHAAAPGPAAAVALRDRLVARWGDATLVDWSTPVPPGDEHAPPAAIVPPPAAIVVWAESTATPEAESHGRLLQALRAHGVPLVLAVDGSTFDRRFASTPERLEQRRRAWSGFADAQGVVLLTVGDVDGAPP